MINKCKLKHKSGNKLCWIFCWMFFKKNMKFYVYIKFYTRQFSAVRSYIWSSNQRLNSICYCLNQKSVTVFSIFSAFLHPFLLFWFSMPFLHKFVPVANSVLFRICYRFYLHFLGTLLKKWTLDQCHLHTVSNKLLNDFEQVAI